MKTNKEREKAPAPGTTRKQTARTPVGQPLGTLSIRPAPVEQALSAQNGWPTPAERPPCTPTQQPPCTLTVRPALATDAVPLGFFFDTALRKDYFLRRGQLQDMLRSPHHRVFVAELDNILVGAAIVTRGTRLVNALVHPAYRGLGIGRALVQSSGACEVRAKLDMSTGDPRGFYQALGFKATGERNEKGNIALMRREPKADPEQW